MKAFIDDHRAIYGVDPICRVLMREATSISLSVGDAYRRVSSMGAVIRNWYNIRQSCYSRILELNFIFLIT